MMLKLYFRILFTVLLFVCVAVGAYHVANAAAQGKLYRSAAYGFAIQYPKGFVVLPAPFTQENRAAFGEKKMVGAPGYDGEFFVFVYSQKDTTLNTLIRAYGSQFGAERKEKRNAIKINGVKATRAVITTTSVPNWYAELILIKKSGNIYLISNGAVKHPLYKKFYQSFRLLKK